VNAVLDAGSWRQALREEWTRWTPPALFAAKTITAALLALWIAFRLDLPSPSSAMVTVFIVAQPVSGLVLEKSFYRLLGTLAGSLVTLLLVAMFAQQRGLFLAAMALWIGLCTAGATGFRNFQSYAFVLAGYTAALVGFAAVLQPQQALQIAVDRVSVVSLGILCAGVVSDGLFPQRLSSQLVALVRGRSLELYRQIEQSLLTPPLADVSTQRHAALIASVFAFETSRSAAALEDPETRARSARLQRLNAQFMAVTSTLHTLERWRLSMHDDAVEAALRPAAEALSAALKLDDGQPPRMALQAQALLPRLRALRLRLPALLAIPREELPDSRLRDYDSAAAVLRQLLTELIGYTDTYAALYRVRDVRPRPGPRYATSADPRAAALNGLRAALVLLVTAGFWIASAWPDAVPAIVNATVFSALFASAPEPATAIRGLLRGFAMGFIAALACALWVLPQVQGFVLLAAVLAPFLLPGVLWLAQPPRAGVGIGYLLMFTVSVAPINVMHYDVAHLVNNAVATFLGVCVALLAFTVLVPGTGLRSRARWLQRLRGELAETCQRPLRGLRHRFESSTRDLLQQAQPASSAHTDAALRTLEAGHAILSLRRALGDAALPVAVRQPSVYGLQRLAQWLALPAGSAAAQRVLALALDALRGALDALEQPDAAADTGPSHRAASALYRLRSVLRSGDFARVLGLELANDAS